MSLIIGIAHKARCILLVVTYSGKWEENFEITYVGRLSIIHVHVEGEKLLHGPQGVVDGIYRYTSVQGVWECL